MKQHLVYFSPPWSLSIHSLLACIILHFLFTDDSVCRRRAVCSVCARRITDSINHSHVLPPEQWQSSKSRDEKLLPQLSWDGETEAGSYQSSGDWRFCIRLRPLWFYCAFFCFYFLKYIQCMLFPLQNTTCGIIQQEESLLETLLIDNSSTKGGGNAIRMSVKSIMRHNSWHQLLPHTIRVGFHSNCFIAVSMSSRASTYFDTLFREMFAFILPKKIKFSK